MARALRPLLALLLATALPALAAEEPARPAGAIADPTRPTGVPAAEARDAQHPESAPPVDPESSRLQMTLSQGPRRSAIVGGRVVKAGDFIEIEGAPARIERIDDGSIVVLRGGAREVLDVHGDPSMVRRAGSCDPAKEKGPCRTVSR